MKPTVAQIIEKAEEFAMDYEYVAVRTQEESFALGEIEHRSNVWVDGDETEEELDGLSATSVKSASVKMHASDHGAAYYFGENVAIVCGNECEYGEDEGELIIEDPVCVHIF